MGDVVNTFMDRRQEQLDEEENVEIESEIEKELADIEDPFHGWDENSVVAHYVLYEDQVFVRPMDDLSEEQMELIWEFFGFNDPA